MRITCTLRVVGRVLVGLILSSLLCSTAWAEPRDPTRAETLFWEGRAAFDAGDFSQACRKFSASEGLDPSRGTLFNWARCEEQLKQLASSRRHYQEVITLFDANDPRLAYARERLAELDSRVPRLNIELSHGAPPEVRVLCDDVELAAERQQVLRLDAGTHWVRVLAPGHPEQRYEVELAEHETRTLEVAAWPAEAPTAAAASSARGGALLARTGGRGSAARANAEAAAFGAGAVGVLLGAIAGGVVLYEKSRYDQECPGHECKSQAGLDSAATGSHWATVSTIAFAVGAVGLGTGGYLVLTARPNAAVTKGGTLPWTSGALLSYQARF